MISDDDWKPIVAVENEYGILETPRQTQIRGLMIEGLSYKEIALVLGITKKTVVYHVGNLLRAWGVKSRYKLAAKDLQFKMALASSGQPSLSKT